MGQGSFGMDARHCSRPRRIELVHGASQRAQDGVGHGALAHTMRRLARTTPSRSPTTNLPSRGIFRCAWPRLLEFSSIAASPRSEPLTLAGSRDRQSFVGAARKRQGYIAFDERTWPDSRADLGRRRRLPATCLPDLAAARSSVRVPTSVRQPPLNGLAHKAFLDRGVPEWLDSPAQDLRRRIHLKICALLTRTSSPRVERGDSLTALIFTNDLNGG